MKKLFKVLIPLIVLVILGYLGYGVFTKTQDKKEVSERIQQVPEFSFQTLQGKVFTKEQMKINTPAIFLFFNSECGYCKEEAEHISKSIMEFKEAQLFFVSYEPKDSIKTFAEYYDLLQHDNIRVLLDPRSDFTHLFGATSIPYSLVYDKNQNLVAKFEGFVKVENLLKSIQ